jgi:hypothetical protein
MNENFYMKDIYDDLFTELTGIEIGGLMFLANIKKRFSNLKIDLEGSFPTFENTIDSVFYSYQKIIVNKIIELNLLEKEELDLFIEIIGELDIELDTLDLYEYPKNHETTFKIFMDFFHNGDDKDLSLIVKDISQTFKKEISTSKQESIEKD